MLVFSTKITIFCRITTENFTKRGLNISSRANSILDIEGELRIKKKTDRIKEKKTRTCSTWIMCWQRQVASSQSRAMFCFNDDI